MKNTDNMWVSAMWNGKVIENALEKRLWVALTVRVQCYKKQLC